MQLGAAQARAAEIPYIAPAGLIIRVGATRYDGIREWLNKVLDPVELAKRDPNYTLFFNHIKIRREAIRQANIRSRHTGKVGWMPDRKTGRIAWEVPTDVAGVITSVCTDFFNSERMMEAFLQDHPEYDLQPDHFA